MGDDLEVLSHALEAEVNLVVSSVGLRTAKYLEKERTGMEYRICDNISWKHTGLKRL